jgi:hypothetical protein
MLDLSSAVDDFLNGGLLMPCGQQNAVDSEMFSEQEFTRAVQRKQKALKTEAAETKCMF